MKCQGLTKLGQPCGVPALVGENKCLFHSDSETALAHRRRGHDMGCSPVTRREMITVLSREFRDLKGNDDEKSRARLRQIIPLLRDMLNEQQQLGKLKKLAKEKGLI